MDTVKIPDLSSLATVLQQPCTSGVDKRYHNRLSMGLSVLNYVLSGDVRYAVDSGSIVWIAGNSDSGRTTLALTCLAEATVSREFRAYNLYYNDTENKRPNIHSYFGKAVSQRVIKSEANTIPDFWKEIMQMPKPFVYVLDSLDGILSNTDYKFNNQYAKQVFDKVRDKESILIITSQYKTVKANKKVSAGGMAPQFYTDYRLQMSAIDTIIKNIQGRDRNVGIWSQVDVIKSKLVHSIGTDIRVPIIAGCGIDNCLSMFYTLFRKGAISMQDDIYVYPKYDLRGTKEELLEGLRQYEQLVSLDLCVGK